jgi:predicted transcriptional regulator
MPRTSNYPQARDQILNHIANEQPKQIDRSQVAGMLGVSMSTAGNYLSVIAEEFPENLRYVRGVLLVFSMIPEHRIPPSARLEMKEKKIEEVKALAQKLEKNHLSHNNQEKTRKAIRELIDQIERL